MPLKTLFIVLLILSFRASTIVYGLEWSITELQSNFGRLSTPGFAGGGKDTTFVITLEHSDGWDYGDNYFFIDLAESTSPFYNDTDIYAEYYANLSLSKIINKNISNGLIDNLGFFKCNVFLLIFFTNLSIYISTIKNWSWFKLFLYIRKCLAPFVPKRSTCLLANKSHA